MCSTKFVFFGPIRKPRWPPRPLIGWDILDFSSETAEQNSPKLDRKQDLNVLYQVCVFRADQKNKIAAPSSDWLRHFWFLLWNRWGEFDETSQEARSQCALPSLCFSGRSENQDGRPSLWLAETFWTSPLIPLNRIHRNLTGSKISRSSTKFVFFGPIRKTRWPPLPLICWYIFYFSSETTERNFMELDRKQDIHLLYQFVFFRLIGKPRWPHWPLIGGDTFIRTLYYKVAQQTKTTHWLKGKIEKVPRGIRGEKSSKDMASSRNLVSTIGALASPKMRDGTRCPEG